MGVLGERRQILADVVLDLGAGLRAEDVVRAVRVLARTGPVTDESFACTAAVTLLSSLPVTGVSFGPPGDELLAVELPPEPVAASDRAAPPRTRPAAARTSRRPTITVSGIIGWSSDPDRGVEP
jgi:hypothetical protein